MQFGVPVERRIQMVGILLVDPKISTAVIDCKIHDHIFTCNHSIRK